MSEHSKPTPIIAEANTKMCPVCAKRSYSPGGTHPQCAVRQWDALRHERQHPEKKVKPKPPQRRSWTKKCPKCNAEVHVRKRTCDCGHDFFSR